jgi:hypothetical protein
MKLCFRYLNGRALDQIEISRWIHSFIHSFDIGKHQRSAPASIKLFKLAAQDGAFFLV